MAVPAHLVGQTLGHYVVLEQIGAGGMGVVYRAHDEQLDRDVALKVLPFGMLADDAARKRFRKEALSLAKLNHPNIATVFEFGSQGGIDFLVTEYIPGVTLDAKLVAGALPEKEVARLGTQLAEGLEAAHQQGVIHRDLKPGNLRITPDGRLKILDFGLAQLMPHASQIGLTVTLTQSQQVTGTLPYMAPEQLRSEPLDFRSDIYAAGAVLYEMATGRRPFEDKLSTILTNNILHKPSPPPGLFNPTLSPRLEDIVLKCLEKEPDNRYQSAKEFAVDLQRLQSPSIAPAVAGARIQLRRPVMMTVIAVLSVLALLFAVNIGGWRERLLRGPTPQIRSLAVLPFENLSRDSDQEYFVDGMTEALITDLSKIGELRVISRTSVMEYKGVRKHLPDIAKELNVEAIVEGSVLRSGERLRITAQLIRATTDEHLWADSYDRDLRDVLAVQSEVARAIAGAIHVTLTPQERLRLRRTRPVNPEAHEAYLKGIFYLHQLGHRDPEKATQYFQRATDIDPVDALAYVGLADTYLFGAVRSDQTFSSREALLKGKAAASKALEIDGTSGGAHVALARIREYLEWDWPGAEAEFTRALEVDPNNADAHRWYSTYLSVIGRHPEAIAEMKRTQELDPLSRVVNVELGWSYLYARQHDRAMEQWRNVLEIEPNYYLIHHSLGLGYLAMGKYHEALPEFEKAITLGGGFDLWNLTPLGRAYALSGNRVKALQILKQINQLYKPRTVPPVAVAMIYSSLGETDRALAFLEKAYEEHSTDLVYLKVDPVYDPLRSEQRFEDLMRRMGLPP